MLSAILAFLAGMGLLAYFISPSEWVVAVSQVRRVDYLWGTGFFFLALLAMTVRWRACLAYRLAFVPAFHTLGVAMAGNLLIPGRSGEPLRVYALAERGFPPEIATSGVVQERLADQLFRLLFLALSLVLAGANGGPGANLRLLGILVGTLAVFAAVGLMVRYRIALARSSGRWFGRLPRLNADTVERFVRNTLTDLATMGSRPGGKQALIWGAISFGLSLVHTNFILDSFFGPESFVMACVVMAFAPPTAAGKPGYYHFLLTASMVVFGAEREVALRAAVVLFFYQAVFYPLWGAAGWLLLRSGPRLGWTAPALPETVSSPEDGAAPPQ